MITEKDIQTRIAEVLTEAGFNVVASEVDEGFQKPAVFVSVFPASAELMTHGMAMEQVMDSVELKYISSVETVEDCVEVTRKFKKLFLYEPLGIHDRRITVQRMEFEVEGEVLYAYFDLSFIQQIDSDEEYEPMEILNLEGGI